MEVVFVVIVVVFVVATGWNPNHQQCYSCHQQIVSSGADNNSASNESFLFPMLLKMRMPSIW